MNIEQNSGKIFIKFTKYNIELNHNVYNRITLNPIRFTSNQLSLDVNQTPGYTFYMMGFMWFEPHCPENQAKVWVLEQNSNKANQGLKEFRDQICQGPGFLAWWFVCVSRMGEVPGSIRGCNIFKTIFQNK